MPTDKPVKEKWKPAQAVVAGNDAKYVPDWEDPADASKERLIGVSAALQKRGKTRFGFTMPKPLVYMQLDASGEFMLQEARAGLKKKSDIQHIKYFADPRADVKGQNLKLWERFLRDYEYNVRNFRSVLVDTGTELMDVRKLAEHGRNSQILQIYYGAFYADFRWLIKEARQHDANVWFTHRMKDLYENGDRTGKSILEGWKGIVYEAQVYVEHDRDDEGVFTTSIKECEQNALVMGQTLSTKDDDNDFPSLAMQIFPDSERKDWE